MHSAPGKLPLLQLLVAMLFANAAGCMAMPLPEEEPPHEPAQVPTPTGPLVYQPALRWADGEVSLQGTGFLARKASGEAVGITSAHFINFDGPALEEAVWLDVITQEPAARFSRSFGKPGSKPARESTDRRCDYLIVFDETESLDLPLLELDMRLMPEVRERVWLPDKHDNAADGYLLVEGTVLQTDENHSVVRLDRRIPMQSQSGSPIISQKTGKVLGTWSGGSQNESHTFIFLTPASAILKAMREAKDRPLLSEVIGHSDKR
jgi:hypothetical protein